MTSKRFTVLLSAAFALAMSGLPASGDDAQDALQELLRSMQVTQWGTQALPRFELGISDPEQLSSLLEDFAAAWWTEEQILLENFQARDYQTGVWSASGWNAAVVMAPQESEEPTEKEAERHSPRGRGLGTYPRFCW
jgi:hypothetical protein